MVEISLYSGEIINRTARDRGLVSVYPLYYRAEESHPSYDRGYNGGFYRGQQAGYTRGFRAGFNAAPYSVTKTNTIGVPTGPETFYRTINTAAGHVYNKNWKVPGGQTMNTAAGNLFDANRFNNGVRKYTNVYAHPAPGRGVVREHFTVRRSQLQTGDVFHP